MPSGIRSYDALGEKPGKGLADLGMLHPVVDHRLEIAELVTAVVAPPLEQVGEHFLVAEEARNRIGELDLAPRTGRHRVQMMEDTRCQDVASNHSLRGWRRARLGLLDDARDAAQPLAELVGLDDPVAADLVLVDGYHSDDRQHLLRAGPGHRKEAAAKPCHRKNRLADLAKCHGLLRL